MTSLHHEASRKLDFFAADRADPEALNAILWAAYRPGTPMAPLTRSFAPR